MPAEYQSHETAVLEAGTSTQVSEHSGRSDINGLDRVVGHYGVRRIDTLKHHLRPVPSHPTDSRAQPSITRDRHLIRATGWT
jgi:hypothetical protein